MDMKNTEATKGTEMKKHRISPIYKPDVNNERELPHCMTCDRRIGWNFKTRDTGRGSGWVHI